MSEPKQSTPNSVNASDDEVKGNNEVTNQTSSVGAQLAHRRQQHGWSIDDVANQLKLAPRQIQAIETDNYAALPTIVMTRGYIRSYAKMLGLDPDTILPSTVPVTAAKIQILGTQSRSTFFSESRSLVGGRNRASYKWIVSGIVLVLAVVVVTQLGGLSSLHKSQAELIVANTTAEDSRETLNTTPSSSTPDASEVSSAISPATNVADIAKPVDMPVVAAKANQLSLTFKQDSWVEIKHADKSILFSGVGKAGSTEIFDIDQPVSVVIGNLAGVEATLRGTIIDLKAGTKNNIARLNLK